MISTSALIDRLHRIPHLDLGLTFDSTLLVKEVAAIDEWVPYLTLYGSEQSRQRYAKIWSGRSLINYNQDSRLGMNEHSKEYAAEVQRKGWKLGPTDLLLKCPYMHSVINELHAYYHSVRVMRIVGHSNLNWHCHAAMNAYYPALMTVHVPIVIPPDFRFAVTPADNLEINGGKAIIKDQERVHQQWYPPARVTYFNSEHYHNVFNHNDSARISMWLYLTVDDRTTRRVFEQAVDGYNGRFIE